MGEIWKDIEGYEGWYQISSYGRVRSVNRTFTNSVGIIRTRRGKILSQNIRAKKTSAYLCVSLTKRCNTKKVNVHRLVAEAFIPNPENKHTVNHKDSDKTNNQVENLEWATYSENHKHSFKNGRRSAKGEECGNAKLKKKDILRIRKMYTDSDITYKEMSNMYGVSSSAIGEIIRGETWGHLMGEIPAPKITETEINEMGEYYESD